MTDETQEPKAPTKSREPQEPQAPTKAEEPKAPPAAAKAEEPKASQPPPEPQPMTKAELSRIKIFILIQALFLFLSPITGGFHYKLWSMMDTAFLLAAIGITGLAMVVETKRERNIVLKFALGLYVAGIIDMSVNVLISGVVGWRTLGIVLR